MKAKWLLNMVLIATLVMSWNDMAHAQVLPMSPSIGRVFQTGSVSLPLKDFVSITTGFYHTCAVTSSGGVKCWGYNHEGQLGDGTTLDRSVPVDVIGLTDAALAVAAGGYHTCALLEGGGVKCWGSNSYGQLGALTTPISGVVAIAAGGMHTCALMASGGVKCWGDNNDGQLGDGTNTSRITPADVTGLTSGVAAIAAGGMHTCALMASGGVKCWGSNNAGQAGSGAGAGSNTPVDVPGLANGVAAIAAGRYHTCALKVSGGVECWGWNGHGQLNATGLTSGVVAIATGTYHTCAVTASNGLKCWGWNEYGQLGDGTTIDRNSPMDVNGLTSGVKAVAGGDLHTCALMLDGGVKCWGSGERGEIGDGSILKGSLPGDVVELAAGNKAIATGGSHTCVMTAGNEVKCWGDNLYGQLGDDTGVNSSVPVDVVGLTGGVQAIASGNGAPHACALMAGGGVKCWGANEQGELGDGTNTNRSAPVDVVGLTGGIKSIAVGDLHTCALTTDGRVKCWGWNYSGQLGDGTNTDHNTPVDVVGLTGEVAAIAAGNSHTCALMVNGDVQCWGQNDAGQLGDGTITNRNVPMAVKGLMGAARDIGAGRQHTCAIVAPSQGTVAMGGIKCWGQNAYGQLGDGTTTPRLLPVDVSGLTNGVSRIAVGYEYTCALVGALQGALVMGGAKCWGHNDSGQIGDGTMIDHSVPTDVGGWTQDATAISAGAYHTCLLTTSGRVKCWGNNILGQLGRGFTPQRLTPVDVVAAVELDNATGAPGSSFVLLGEGLPPSLPATMSINGHVLTSTVPVNEAGGFIVFINTTGADAGDYSISVSGNSSARARLTLDPSAPLQVPEGGGLALHIPPGIALKHIYLPLVLRQG